MHKTDSVISWRFAHLNSICYPRTSTKSENYIISLITFVHTKSIIAYQNCLCFCPGSRDESIEARWCILEPGLKRKQPLSLVDKNLKIFDLENKFQ